MVKKLSRNIYLTLVFIFLYLPIMFLIVFSFNEGKYSGNWKGFSLHWYQELFQDQMIMNALGYTVTIAILASIISTIIGLFGAYSIFRMKSRPKQLILTINNIPLLNPDIVTGVSLMALFVFLQFKLGYLTMLMAHITFCIPYVILSILPKLKQMPKDIVDAALDLGATPLQAFYKVVLPEVMPGVITGALIAFTLSIDDFVISFFTTGNGVNNLSIAIFSMARRGISPKINALSTIMFVVVMGLLLIINLRKEKEK
ncbi:MAG: ABC transporter permease [Clostridiales bacterium]|nr:ABC transporter permease [Clostridiales bacterium]